MFQRLGQRLHRKRKTNEKELERKTEGEQRKEKRSTQTGHSKVAVFQRSSLAGTVERDT